MKIGILTYNRSHNYGAFLQAYSLCQKLNTINDIDCEIINYNLKTEDKRYKKKRTRRPGFLFTYIRQDHMFDDILKEQKLSDNLILDNDYEKVLNTLDGKYDVIVTGSDEIWRKGSRGFPNIYWLPGERSFKKMSYAASGRMQIDKMPEEMKEKLKSLYKDYDYIGVRDECTKNMVNTATGENKSIRNCDPAFFYDRFKDKKELKETIRNKYNLPNKKIVVVAYDEPSLIRKLRRRLGRDYYFVSLSVPMYTANKIMCTVTPFEWADIIGGADFVITAYYHGMLFALNQNTPFMAIDRRATRDNIETSKLYDFLSYTHLEDRYTMSEDITKDYWDKLARQIVEESERDSVDFSETVADQKKLFDSFEKELLKLSNNERKEE